ncbi:MAG TPA: hydroxyacid dehydrogenase [Pyrinomonadaceae bacterium]|jgi:phosphoglycerate dehydrogenase-like enzyme|nr:hydroxyacid dehydrogenase [Pyrinomonadaceae bacterium]
METQDGIILLDPHPRPLDLIFSPEDKARLERLGRVVWHEGSPAPEEHVEKYLPETVAIIGQTPMPRERLERAPRLRMIANVESNFLPNVDYEECHRRNVHVVATGPVFAQPVAEMALGMALSSARRTHEADASVRRGDESLYGEADNYDSFLLRGKTLGLLGCGNLGRALLPLLRPFSRDIIAHDPWIHPSVLREMNVEPVGFDELFERSRVLFVLAATTTENQGAIGARQFSSMKDGSVFVLVSRAGVVDFEAMLDAAESGRIRVAVDVFPEEPIPAGHRARTTPNTLLSAHRAGNIPEIWHGMGSMVVDDLELVLRGLPPQRCQRAAPETVARLRSKPVS